MKEQEDKSGAEHRAMCTVYYAKNEEQKKKKCCPIDNVNNRLAYCTRTKCSKMVDCKEGMYCHPKNNVCCYLGVKKLDGSAHEKGNTCQGTCPDADKFGTMVPQYCVREESEEKGGRCYLSPYVRVKERSRTVNPVYKTVCIVCVVLTLVFAFLAVIMFVNYRSRNFCDKYRPKRKVIHQIT
ncbi:hypothetical protein OESDEN_02872 [Oesophagostomum dentatum]|uniref:Uncharacterized protein n=1 Tax=Oesophagostomum dentatum TaxID=61180 RepID=A0A0B1TMY2_OESDE|nr:hypothetical protein OESDEN_02872 [Oesophagostomum dentatum]